MALIRNSGVERRDEQLLDFMVAHPILMDRPVVETSLGTRLCRPSEAVLDLLPEPQRGAFSKEDGEAVIDAKDRRVADDSLPLVDAELFDRRNGVPLAGTGRSTARRDC